MGFGHLFFTAFRLTLTVVYQTSSFNAAEVGQAKHLYIYRIYRIVIKKVLIALCEDLQEAVNKLLI